MNNEQILMSRLERLERDNLRIKKACIGLLAIAALVVFCGAQPNRDEGIVLRDRAGKVRARLGVASDNIVRLSLYDRWGKQRVFLGESGDRDNPTPRLTIKDRQEKVRIRLGFSDNGQARVRLYDANGRPTKTIQE